MLVEGPKALEAEFATLVGHLVASTETHTDGGLGAVQKMVLQRPPEAPDRPAAFRPKGPPVFWGEPGLLPEPQPQTPYGSPQRGAVTAPKGAADDSDSSDSDATEPPSALVWSGSLIWHV